MLGKSTHIGFKTGDKTLALLDLFGIVLQQIIFQTELLALVTGFHQLQPGNIYV